MRVTRRSARLLPEPPEEIQKIGIEALLPRLPAPLPVADPVEVQEQDLAGIDREAIGPEANGLPEKAISRRRGSLHGSIEYPRSAPIQAVQ
jgi:hypothetical protein